MRVSKHGPPFETAAFGGLLRVRAKTLDPPGNPLEKAGQRFLKVHVAPVAKAIGAAIVAPPS